MNRQSIILLLLLCATAFLGCGENEPIDNPTPADSQYPYLYSSDNALYMSWLSKDTSFYSTVCFLMINGAARNPSAVVPTGSLTGQIFPP